MDNGSKSAFLVVDHHKLALNYKESVTFIIKNPTCIIKNLLPTFCYHTESVTYHQESVACKKMKKGYYAG